MGGAERIRSSNGLPYTGIIALDPADLNILTEEVVLHEVGHGKFAAFGSSLLNNPALLFDSSGNRNAMAK